MCYIIAQKIKKIIEIFHLSGLNADDSIILKGILSSKFNPLRS